MAEVKILTYQGFADDKLVVTGKVQVGLESVEVGKDEDGEPIHADLPRWQDVVGVGWVSWAANYLPPDQVMEGVKERDKERKRRPMTGPEFRDYCAQILVDAAGLNVAPVDLPVEFPLDEV